MFAWKISVELESAPSSADLQAHSVLYLLHSGFGLTKFIVISSSFPNLDILSDGFLHMRFLPILSFLHSSKVELLRSDIFFICRQVTTEISECLVTKNDDFLTRGVNKD